MQKESDYYPFGGEMVVSGSDINNYKFTGKERDAESGLDDLGARYYGSSTGRFMSPDWAERPNAVPYAVLGDPQSLNLFSYVSDNPLERTDPDGHQCAPAGGICDYAKGLKTEEPTSSDEQAAENQYLAMVAQSTQAQNQNPEQPQGSKKPGFWGRLGQHLGNLFSGHSWNYEMRESVTHSILPAEPNRYVTAATDVAGVVAAVKDVKGLGYASAVISVANDHSPLNTGMTAASLAPGAAGFAATFIGAEADLLNFEVQTVGEGMIEAIPGKTMDDGNGHQVPNPAEMDPCEALGGCH